MKKFLLLNSCLAFFCILQGQSTAGITGVRDTAYSVVNEYNRQLKNFPFISLPAADTTTVLFSTNIIFCNTKERALALDLTLPRSSGKKKRPALIFIHGGGWRSGSKTMHQPLLRQLAARGYVCITPEYRLSTEALYPAAIHDIKSVIRWTREQARKYNIDPEKIAVAGHSAGGELAAMMGATNSNPSFEGTGCFPEQSSVVNAVIDLDGTLAFIHPESGEGDDSKKISAATHWFGYSKTERPDIWINAAPLTHAGPHCPPFYFINSGVDRMHAGREDFRKILTAHSIYSGVHTFPGSPHSFVFFQPWLDTIINKMDRFLQKAFAPQNELFHITVAADGSGDFTSIQAAIRSVPDHNKNPTEIFVKNGVYYEKIFIDSLKPFITITGEDKFKTIITHNDHTGKISPSGETISTRTSWTLKINAAHFTARNISIRNDAGFSAGQAVALESDGDFGRFINCRITGFQDVLLIDGGKGRQYFRDCYIEGTTDFIFGSSTAWFENCVIHSRKNSHVTAASTPAENEFGYVFNRCSLTGDTSLHQVSLGRPWRPFAKVVYLNCEMGAHIKPEGWSTWNNNDNHKTTYYAEYKSKGPGANPEKRLDWTHQLTRKEARKYSISRVLHGWKPEQE